MTNDGRTISAATAERIDSGCALEPFQVRLLSAVTELRNASQESHQEATQDWHAALQVRWTPTTPTGGTRPEVRATTPQNHIAKLLAALKAKAKSALTAAIVAAYVDAYTGDDPDSSDRLAALTSEAPTWSANLLNMLATPGGPDELQAAGDTADVCATAGESAGTLDDIEAGGGTTYNVIVQDGACQVCQDDEGEHDLSEPSPIPHHVNCKCEIEKP